jgi:hypothetical protein
VHPLAGWALDPTPLPHVRQGHAWGGTVSDDELDDDNDDDMSSGDESPDEGSAGPSRDGARPPSPEDCDGMTCALHCDSYS